MVRRVSAVAIIATFVLMMGLPTTGAYQEIYIYPPWAFSDASHSYRYAGCCYDSSLREFYARTSDGVARFSEHIQASGPAGGINDLAYMTFWGTQFVAPYTGTYTMDYEWHLTGTAAMCINTPIGDGSTRVALWLLGNLKHVNTGYWVLGNDASTTVFDYTFTAGYYGFCQSWSWNNALFFVGSFQGYLYAGDTYELWTYAKAFHEAISIEASWNQADLDLTLTNNLFFANTNAGGPPCLASGTPVLMGDGTTRTIESVHPGDQVMSYDFAKGTLVPSTVTLSRLSHVNQIVVINNGLLRITPMGQALSVRDGGRAGWLYNANGLRTGMQLFNPTDGTWTTIYAIATQSGNFSVYDLSVTPIHNFVANGVVVHNK